MEVSPKYPHVPKTCCASDSWSAIEGLLVLTAWLSKPM